MTARPQVTFKEAARKFWRSLLARHNGKSKYGPIPIERKDFEAWLLDRSIAQQGLIWRCEYTGNHLQLMAKTQAGRLTIDHRVPLAKGGKSTLDNLAVCSEKANKAKGSLSVGYFGRFLSCISTWPEEEKEEIFNRLAAYKPIWRKKRG